MLQVLDLELIQILFKQKQFVPLLDLNVVTVEEKNILVLLVQNNFSKCWLFQNRKYKA